MTDERDTAAMERDYYERYAHKPPLSAPAETHKESEKVTTVTVEFERMPGVNVGTLYPITFRFEEYPMIAAPRREGSKERKYKTVITVCTVTGRGHLFGMGGAQKRKDDKSNLEMAMRKSSWRAIYWTNDKSIRPIYRAFRRWMWLAKAAHECHHNDSCRLCPAGHAPILLCRPKQMNDIIAREFGRVKVAIT